MGADGTYLSGEFARQSNKVARRTLTNGLGQWQKIAKDGDFEPKPVPTNRLAIYGGEELREGGLKLEVAYRDLPRGKVQRPGNAQFPNPYNLGWFDLKPAEAKTIATNSSKKTAIPDRVFRKLANTRLKDAVRGQMSDWKEGDLKEGQLYSQLISRKGGIQTYQLSGSATMKSGGLWFEPQFHGTAVYDTSTGQFAEFRLIAAGQRAGKGAANGRATDLGPAPMAIAFTLYKP